MSLFTGQNGTILREEWAASIPEYAAICANDKEATEDYVPSRVTDLANWAYLGPNAGNPDRARRFVLLYQPQNTLLAHTPICVRIQGFVVKANLAALGTWRGDYKMASRAVQFIELGPGSLHGPWDEQFQRLQCIHEFIFRSLNKQFQPSVDSTLSIHRKVFSKVTEGGVYRELEFFEDPKAQARRIRKHWGVSHRLDIGKYSKGPQGGITRLPFFAIQPGDFVDITATFDIVTFRGTSDRSMKVDLSLHQIIQVKERTAEAPPEDAQPHNTVVSGFKFSDSPADSSKTPTTVQSFGSEEERNERNDDHLLTAETIFADAFME